MNGGGKIKKINKSYTVFKGFFNSENESSFVFTVSLFHLIGVMQGKNELSVGDFFELESCLFRWVGWLVVFLLFHFC